MPDQPVKVIRIGFEAIVDLRHSVLRAGLPRESAVFPGDELETSRHFAAMQGKDLVGCVTLHVQPYHGEAGWQLRGMAVETALQRCGVGAALLMAAEADVADTSSIRLLWCNAREVAAGFYRRFGWIIDSDLFVIPTAGPHVRMVRRLPMQAASPSIDRPQSVT